MTAKKNWIKGNIVAFCCIILLCAFNYYLYSTFRVDFAKISQKKVEDVDFEDLVIDAEEDLTAEEKLIIYGDKTKATKELQQKVLHERFPKDKILLANYINSLDFDDNKQEILKKLDYAEKVDPKNALYNYYRASILFSEAIKKNENREEISEKQKKEFLQGNYQNFADSKKLKFKVVDAKKLSQAVEQFYIGIDKPILKTYIFEMHNIRSHLKFDKIDSFEKQLAKITFDGFIKLKHLKYLKDVEKLTTFNAKIQFIKGNRKPAIKLFNNFQKYVLQLNNDSRSLVGKFVSLAMAKDYYYNGALFFNKIGDKEKLSLFANKFKVIDEFSRKNFKGEETKDFDKKVGYLGAIILPSVINTYPEEIIDEALRHERLTWYKRMDVWTNMVMFNYLFVIFLIIWIVALIARFRSPADEIINFKPTNKEFLVIIFWSIGLPLVIHELFLNVNFLSGRYYNLTYNCFAFVMQKWLLLVLCVLPCCWVMRYFVRKWCKEKNISIVGRNKFFITNVWFLSCFLLFTSTPLLMNILDIAAPKAMSNALNLVVTVLKVYILFLIVWWLLYCLDLAKKCTQYKRLYWINLMPYLAASMTIIYLSVTLINMFQINYYFQKDEYIFTKNINYESTKIESDAVRMVKEFIDEQLLNKK